MITSKTILTLICFVNLQMNYVNGQVVSVTVSSVNGFSSSASHGSSAGFGFGIPSLLNNFYRPLGGVLNGLSTFPHQFFSGNTIRNQENLSGHRHYHQTHFQGANNHFERPYINNPNHQPFGQWTVYNRNYYNHNIHRPNHNNNPSFNQNLGINGVNNKIPHQSRMSNPIPNDTQTNLQQNYQTGKPRPQNPTWSIQTQNSNSNVQTRPVTAKYETPWSSAQESIISKPATNPLGINHFQNGLISKVVDDPLNTKNTRDSTISEPAGNSNYKPNYSLNHSNTKPDINKFRTPPQSSLITNPKPFGLNNFQDSLISKTVDDPLNLKNTQSPIFSTTAAPFVSTLSPTILGKPKPGTIINPDSPYYIPADFYDPASLIDIKRS